jgi:hypothetical protein
MLRNRGRENGGRGFRFADPDTLSIRLFGCLIGLASILLPWGSVIVRDDYHATSSITSIGMLDLLTSSSLVAVIASILFISATVLALLDPRALIGQVAALIIVFITIPCLLADIVSTLSPLPPGWSLSTSMALGFYVGIFSAVILAIPFLQGRRKARWESQAGHAETHLHPEDLSMESRYL